jgi:hypothetical protein
MDTVALFDTYDYICSFATRHPLDTKVARGVLGCYLHFTLHRSPSIRIFDHGFSDLIPERIPPTGYGNSLPLRGGSDEVQIGQIAFVNRQ